MARRRRLGPEVQKWIRRTHMYLGIALAPWVVLYGVTAVLFNHSDWFTDSTRTEIDGAALRGELARLGLDPDAVADAALKVAARSAGDARALPASIEVDAEGFDGAGTPVRVGDARIVGGYTIDGVRAGSKERVRISLNGLGRGGSIRLRPAPGADKDTPAWARELDPDERDLLGAPDEATILEVATAAALAGGLELEDARVRRRPRIDLAVEDGSRWDARVDLDGEVDARPAADGGTSLRSQLLRLHLQHGDPGFAGARFAWALIVDAMGVSMVLWAISGLVMWWSIKKTRRAGAVALAGGLAGIAILGLLVLRAAGMA